MSAGVTDKASEPAKTKAARVVDPMDLELKTMSRIIRDLEKAKKQGLDAGAASRIIDALKRRFDETKGS